MKPKVMIAPETRHQGRARLQAQTAARALAAGHRVLLWSKGEFVRVIAVSDPAKPGDAPCR